MSITGNLTPKQKDVLKYIREYYEKKSYAPSLQEIARHFKKSVPTIHQFTTSLINKGYLERDSKSPRNIKPVSFPANSKSQRKFKIGIVGYGIVGQAVEYGFSTYETHIYDKYKQFEDLDAVVQKSDYIFVCLPTPIKSDESGIDLAIINENVAKIAKLTAGTDKIIVIKSTVIPGTTESFIRKYPKCLFCFNPEFLRESSFLQDFVNTDRVIIGTNNDMVFRRISSLYQSVMPLIPIFQTDPTTAEMVKYMANCYLATKVIFANEMYDICQQLGIKYDEVKRMVVTDKRIEDTHLDVTSVRGFGKKCFPKDLLALRALAKSKGVDTSMLDTVWKKNIKIRKVRDWEEIPFAVTPAFGNRD